MSRVFEEKQIFSMAWLKEANPLPDIQKPPVTDTACWDTTLTEQDKKYFTYGRVSSILPYLAQDEYDREKTEQEQPVIVLENEHIRAEFLPWMGGRLWSLKKDGRELLCRNPVVQPCNLALRNAWCSGGVEWNIGMRGHHMMTCSPMFPETIRLEDGTAGVRFYEFERLRGVVYRVEAYLPPESEFLFVQVTIENPKGNGETPMYWWSNIAVPETDTTRVIAPAEEAIVTLYKEGKYLVSRAPVPVHDGVDASYPTNLDHSVDFFYDIPQQQRKFITALDHGRGLVQCSTDRLLGRKLFLWGMGVGGRHWQEFLADESTAYVEIQAGIAVSQNDHIPMPADAVWSWLEAYGELKCDVDGMEYSRAVEKANCALDELLPKSVLLNEQAERARIIARTHGELLYSGSGWGALENAWRAKVSLPALSDICVFPADSMDREQEAWLCLLKDGVLPETDADTVPASYMIAGHWKELLETGKNGNWYAKYQLAVMRWAAGDEAGCRRALEESAALCENGWAWNALAEISRLDGNYEEAASQREKARKLLSSVFPVFLKYCQDLKACGRYEELLAEIDAAGELGRRPRAQALRAAALIGLGRCAEAREILLRPLIIPDMREGELSLGELWDAANMKEYGISREEAGKRYPLPEQIDFRMH